ncbi:MAG: hypothetical protein H0V89_14330 [Deltaproteobacteria bacterium]|nr:hypothetical protein [Deltaproteobacteria bacterium]
MTRAPWMAVIGLVACAAPAERSLTADPGAETTPVRPTHPSGIWPVTPPGADSPDTPDPPGSATNCDPLHLVATDIDETLTTDNDEWDLQIDDPSYDPAMRPDANTLLQGYAARGYTIAYVTARWDFEMSDGRLASEHTVDWLHDHGFPLHGGLVFLAPEPDHDGDEVVEYKSGVLLGLQAEGWALDWAYGNAETDIEAFLLAGFPDDSTFLVGDRAGELEVPGIPNEDAYTAHLAHLASVPDVRCE